MARVGLDAKLYRNTGTWAAPAWNEIPNVRDLTTNLEMGTTDASKRGLDWRRKLPTLKDASLEFEMLWELNTEDLDLDAIRSAFFNRTTIEILALSGDIAESNNTGVRADWAVTGFTRGEPLEDAIKYTVKLEVGVSANDPEEYVVP